MAHILHNGWPWCIALLASACMSAEPASVVKEGTTQADVRVSATYEAPLSATCAIDGKMVDCSIALWDVALGFGAVKPGMTPRSYCQQACAQGIRAPLETDTVFGDPGACRHSTRIRGLSCDDCPRLADGPVPLRCDNDPCTLDWCDGLSCFHRGYLWVGTVCASHGCQSTLQCDPSACLEEPECQKSGYRVCAGCPPD